MNCGFQVFKTGNTKILRFRCEECDHTSPESSEICTRGIIKALLEHPDVEEVLLPGLFDNIYVGKSLLALKQLASAYETCHLLSLTKPSGCGKCWKERKEELKRIVEFIPIKSRLALSELRRMKKRTKAFSKPSCRACLEDFSKVLENMCEVLERCSRLEDALQPFLKPCISFTRVLLNPPAGKLVDAYQVGDASVRIYQLPDLQHFYFVVPSEFSLSSEKIDLLRKTQEKLFSKVENPLPSREQLRKSVERCLLEISAEQGILLENNEVDFLASIFLRHTIGLGMIELLLDDPWVQDIYIDAPLGHAPVYLYHRNYEECITNLYLTPADAEPLVSKFRAWSGRSFSESNPVLELEWGRTRVTVVGKPLSPQGISFSFRRHRPLPWTLAQFVASGLLPSTVAAFLSLAVDAQSSILITGSRGSGKTSLLGSLLLEIHPKFRIVVVEDTPELPVDRLRELGYKIQTLQTKSPLSASGEGVSAEDALRTVLRMGESVLVLGEVRGPEAKVLFEAMRIGAVGNSVLGTLHGSSSRDVLERIVYDLGIPASSFKSTDLIVCLGPVRKSGSISKRRKLLQLTEVRKFPQLDLYDLVVYDSRDDDFIVSFDRSEFLRRVCKSWGIKTEEIKEILAIKAKVIETLVHHSKEKGNPRLLEDEFILKSNLILRSLLEKGLENIFEQWHHWLLGAIHES
jgi:type IV secretory pathway ATPase VirB11/archaellum biosynthesis ATPase